jgi:hypothetical protein
VTHRVDGHADHDAVDAAVGVPLHEVGEALPSGGLVAVPRHAGHLARHLAHRDLHRPALLGGGGPQAGGVLQQRRPGQRVPAVGQLQHVAEGPLGRRRTDQDRGAGAAVWSAGSDQRGERGVLALVAHDVI